jgi:RNA polymerase sigma factor (sigma-70 family)
MQWINVLSRHHKEWINIVRSFGECSLAEDIVQEMYLRIHDANSGEKAVINDEPNRAFVWVILKNTFITYEKEKTRIQKVSIDELNYLCIEESEPEKHEAISKIDQKLQKELSKWHTYDRELFKVHTLKGKSMREISNGANISLSSIFNTLKNCKTRLKQKIGEDYLDYKNEEYDRI